MKRATLRVLLNETSHAKRRDLVLYVDSPDGRPRRVVLLDNVPEYYAECALRGALKTLEAIGYEVGEKP